jgi:phosphodiesterase/alkaline phosphatase D-like protein
VISFSSQPCDSQLHRTSEGKFDKLPLTSIGAVLIGTDPRSDDFQLVIGRDGPQRYNATIRHRDGKSFEYWSENQHHVTVEGLEPDTTYYYQCIVLSDEDILWKATIDDDDMNVDDVDVKEEARYLRRLLLSEKGQELFRFRTTPKQGREERIKVAIVGDLGVFDHTTEMLSVLSSQLEGISYIVLVGDISYANGNHR